jgi:hypothetical protein
MERVSGCYYQSFIAPDCLTGLARFGININLDLENQGMAGHWKYVLCLF